jgi:flavodoxin I
MRAIVVFDSLYGNTEKIAQVIGKIIAEQGEVQVIRVGEMRLEQLKGIELLTIGSPTQQFKSTAAMKNFLNSIPKNGLIGVKVAAFDTRLTLAEIEKSPALSFFEKIFGYATERIAKSLKAKGGVLVLPGEGFYVEGMKGPLMPGEQERAENWARNILTKC